MKNTFGAFGMSFLCLLLFSPLPVMAKHKKQQEPQQPDVPAPVAQSGPSFAATRDWMVAALSNYGGTNIDGSGIWRVYSDVAISNSCVLTFQSVSFQTNYKNGEKPFGSVLVTIPLGAVASSSLFKYQGRFDISIDTGNISAVTYTGAIDYNSGGGAPDISATSELLEIERMPRVVAGQPMPDSPQDRAKRLLPTFQHMVDICKSSYQAPPAQPKQPF